MADTPKPKTESAPTERVVLRKIVVPLDGQFDYGGNEAPARDCEAWVPIITPDGEPRIFTAWTKLDAIEQYAGKDGVDHPGYYRAPALRSWKEVHGWVEPAQQRLDHVVGD